MAQLSLRRRRAKPVTDRIEEAMRRLREIEHKIAATDVAFEALTSRFRDDLADVAKPRPGRRRRKQAVMSPDEVLAAAEAQKSSLARRLREAEAAFTRCRANASRALELAHTTKRAQHRTDYLRAFTQFTAGATHFKDEVTWLRELHAAASESIADLEALLASRGRPVTRRPLKNQN